MSTYSTNVCRRASLDTLRMQACPNAQTPEVTRSYAKSHKVAQSYVKLHVVYAKLHEVYAKSHDVYAKLHEVYAKLHEVKRSCMSLRMQACPNTQYRRVLACSHVPACPVGCWHVCMFACSHVPVCPDNDRAPQMQTTPSCTSFRLCLCMCTTSRSTRGLIGRRWSKPQRGFH